LKDKTGPWRSVRGDAGGGYASVFGPVGLGAAETEQALRGRAMGC